jgi:low-affinity inorganic phosphate transporter
MFGLETSLLIILILCIIATCAFEFINGFHDTANAVATVIYTHSLKPVHAVVLSGILNFAGVFLGGITVAMGIVKLLPMDVLLGQDISLNISLVLSILLSAIIWNLGTWYYGIPCSSSHTLIGSILGVGIAYSIHKTGTMEGVNWHKAEEMGLSLLFSPLFGFGLVLFLMFLLRSVIPNREIFETPKEGKTPPLWIRAILIFTCSAVSFAHGSNDGQKGVGLLMVILISILPAYFALNTQKNSLDIAQNVHAVEQIIGKINSDKLSSKEQADFNWVKSSVADLSLRMKKASELRQIAPEQKPMIRRDIVVIIKEMKMLMETGKLSMSSTQKEKLNTALKGLDGHISYAPTWVILMISLSLGIGTMIGWKRIVVTIGEKIGKEHLTYAQGASSEIVAASTIGVSTYLGLPVSTTHVLSSGIAGSMVAGKGIKNLQGGTIRNIAIAWVLTVPVCIVLSIGLFFVFNLFL